MGIFGFGRSDSFEEHEKFNRYEHRYGNDHRFNGHEEEEVYERGINKLEAGETLSYDEAQTVWACINGELGRSKQAAARRAMNGLAMSMGAVAACAVFGYPLAVVAALPGLCGLFSAALRLQEGADRQETYNRNKDKPNTWDYDPPSEYNNDGSVDNARWQEQNTGYDGRTGRPSKVFKYRKRQG